jgi:hypothetical protein
MKKNHRRELYGPTDPSALDAGEVFGPDGVRVTLRVEPAIDRYRRWRFKLSTPNVVTDPIKTFVSYRVLPDLVQRHVLRDGWRVNVEADSGERCLVKANDRDHAVDLAKQIRTGVQAQGVAFIRTFAS